MGRLGPLATWLRWICLIVGGVLAATTSQPDRESLVIAGSILLTDTIYRTLRPLQIYPATWRAEALVIGDLLLAVVAIAFTNTWSSPFLLMPLPLVLLAAYGWGYREGAFAAMFTAGTIVMVDVLSGASEDAMRTGLFVSLVVVAAAIVGGYTRQLWLEAEERERETADEVARMSLANDLFHALHDVVRTLPDSLDLAEVVASARDTFREVFAPDVLVVALADETSNAWHTQLVGGRGAAGTPRRHRPPAARREALDASRRGPRAEHGHPERAVERRVREQRPGGRSPHS